MSKTVSVTGQTELVARMRRIRSKLPNAMAGVDVERLLLSRVLRRFENSVSPDGVAWPALKESTVRRKKLLGARRPEKALERTERLVRGIRIISGSTSGLLVANTGLGFRIGVDDPVAAIYGRLHQQGHGSLPQRKFMGLSASDVSAVTAFTRRRIKDLVE